MAKVAPYALWLGLAGLLVGGLLLATILQRPDGDATALQHFAALHDQSARHDVRHALWLNGAGALLAWGALHRLLEARRWGARLFWVGVLVLWGGWAWNQTRGWEGELFLEPGVPTPLGVDRSPVVTFAHFLVPPAPDGPGRALALCLLVDGQRYDIAEATPYRGAGWALVPRWYGATVQGEALSAPLFFGASSTQHTTLRDGRALAVTLDVDALHLSSAPPIEGLTATHHAILRARFAPGDPLKVVGAGIATLGLLLSWMGRGYNAALNLSCERGGTCHATKLRTLLNHPRVRRMGSR